MPACSAWSRSPAYPGCNTGTSPVNSRPEDQWQTLQFTQQSQPAPDSERYANYVSPATSQVRISPPHPIPSIKKKPAPPPPIKTPPTPPKKAPLKLPLDKPQ